MGIIRTFRDLFTPPTGCGPECRAIGHEVEAMALADQLELLKQCQKKS